MSSKVIEKLQLELKDTLESLCRLEDGGKTIEVVAAGSRHDDLRLLFRVYDEERWLKVVSLFLQEEQGENWYSYVGKKYLLKEGKMVYAWNIVLESPELDVTVQKVRKILLKADDSLNKAKKNESFEVPTAEAVLPPSLQERVRPVRSR